MKIYFATLFDLPGSQRHDCKFNIMKDDQICRYSAELIHSIVYFDSIFTDGLTY